MDNFIFDCFSYFMRLLLPLVLVACVLWILWSAAVAVPTSARMRWPWTLWLLIVPIVSNLITLFVLVALARSYQRYFLERKLPGHGGCGYGTAVATGIGAWLTLLKYVPSPKPALEKKLPSLAALVHYVHIGGSWAAAVAGIAGLALVFMMWGLRGQIRKIENRVKNAAPTNEALAWLEGNFNQSAGDTPSDDPPPGK